MVKILGVASGKKSEDFKMLVKNKYLFWGLLIGLSIIALLLLLLEKLYSLLKNNRELMDLDKINEKIFKREQKENNGVFDTNQRLFGDTKGADTNNIATLIGRENMHRTRHE